MNESEALRWVTRQWQRLNGKDEVSGVGRRNVVRVLQERTLDGRLFQIAGAGERKPRAPNEMLQRVTERRLAEAEFCTECAKVNKIWGVTGIYCFMGHCGNFKFNSVATNVDASGYLLFFTTDATQPDSEWVVEGVVGVGTSTTVHGLSPLTTYYFKVQARNSVGVGPLCPTVIFRTPACEY